MTETTALSELTPKQRAKIDAKLASRLNTGDDPVEVVVHFAGEVPSVPELAALKLGRAGAAVIGRISLERLRELLDRDDVARLEGLGHSMVR
jgi:hypothetical protein